MKASSRRAALALTLGALGLPGILSMAGAESVAGQPAAHEAADLVVTGAHIRTPTGWAGAMAVRHGVIVAMGDAASVAAWRGANTHTLELQGATVLPGLHDVHVHPLFGGVLQRRCLFAQGAKMAVLQAKVKECAGRLKPGEWLRGGQWDAPALGVPMHRRQLDAIAGDHPVMLDDTSGHSSWVNSRALALAGITRATPNPPGGIIEHDANGDVTGVLREDAAIDLVRSKIPPPTQAEIRSALGWSLQQMLSVGITSYTEASLGFVAGGQAELDAYAAMTAAGEIKQRTTLCLNWAPGQPELDAVIARRNLYTFDRVRPSCVKIFLDGVPTDSHTAAMLEPYAEKMAGRDDDASRYGLLLVKQDVLNEAVTRFDAMGLTVKFHAAGDAAVRAGLTAIEAARKANGFSGQMHNVGHCTFVAKDDLPRARRIGATFEVSPYLWGPSPINDSISAAVGPDTIRRVWPVREMLDAGALVVPGSDWAVVPSVNPWIGIEQLVTRQEAGGSARSFGQQEAISVGEALDLFTVNAAKQERMADEVGRLEVGMRADFIVLDRDPYAIKPTDLHATRVLRTFIDGEQVYDASRPPLTVEVYAGKTASVNSFIVSNGVSQVLIDAQRKTVEAQSLAERIRASGLPLTDIFITHGHTDHFTGMAFLHRAFPEARIVVASEAIKRDIKAYAIYMDSGGESGSEPALEPVLRPRSPSNPGGFDYEKNIQVLAGKTLELRGGGRLEITDDYPATEAPHLATVYSPDLNALFLSDLGYNRVHLWMGDDIDLPRVEAWRAELVKLAARYAGRQPRLFPGHGAPGDLRMVDAQIGYIDDYLRVVRGAASQEEAMQRMKALYPGYDQADFFLKYSVLNHVK